MLVDGDECLEAMWGAIRGAGKSVWLEIYMIDPDAVGRRTLELLAAAASRGCDVLLVYDHVGSAALWDYHLTALRAAGARVLAFNPIWPWRRQGPFLFRDHRKLLVIDGELAFTGGRNLTVRYGGSRWGVMPFRDTQIEVRGPVVADLCALMRETLGEIGAAVRLPLVNPGPAGEHRVQVVPSNARRNRRPLLRHLLRVIRDSRRYCYVTTPYLLPAPRMMRMLRHRARHGVDVRILVPARSDVLLVDLARAHILHRLLSRGVRIFQYRAPLHAKTLVCDDHLGWVGSFNLDRFTSAHNLEVGLALYDRTLAEALRARFLADLEHAEELAPEALPSRSWHLRLVRWLSYRVMNLRFWGPGPGAHDA